MALVRDGEVFHGTVSENVHLHRQDVSAADVRDALRQLGLLDSVLTFDDGCETILASNGSPLTAHQCRLLNVARAVSGRPGLLLIDGVLDALSDKELDTVMEFLTRPDQPWTLIVGTGRESIAEFCEGRLELPQNSAQVRT